jgi:SAM-dependent methyltransferase
MKNMKERKNKKASTKNLAVKPMNDHIELNRALWDHWATLHPQSKFYDEAQFLKHPMSLHSIELDLLGDLKGKRVLHMQCHFGQDTLSLKTLGASEVVGLDFSEVALAEAKKLADKCNIEASWVHAEASNIVEELVGTFDVVFASYGVLGWHPAVSPWMNAAFSYLKPGGQLILADFHPVLWILDSNFEQITYPYFNTGVIVEEREGSYASPEAKKMSNMTWNHTISDIVLPILDNPERDLIYFGEYDWSPYALFDSTSPAPNRFQIKGKEGLFPLVYSLKARKV